MSIGGAIPVPSGVDNTPNEVKFTQQQMAWLEKMFGERDFADDTPAQSVFIYLGTRRVLHAVRRRVQS